MTSNGIISAPVTITDIKNTIGLNSTGLMDLVSRARTGGVNGRAFNTVEGGGTINDGYLIDGAAPFWNIWSNDQPGEWIPPTEVDGPLRLRLRRDSGGGRYRAAMGDFRGYNQNASAPIPGGGEGNYVATGGTTTYSTTLKPRTGSYNWKKVSGATLFQARVYDGKTLITSSTPAAIGDNVSLPISFTVNLAISYTKVYTTRIYVGSGTVNDFNSLGYLPVTGEIVITVSPKPVLTASVKVKGRVNVFSMAEGVVAQNTARYSGTYRLNSGVTTDGTILKSMVYSWGTSEAGNNGSLTVTSFNYKEGPSYLRSYPPGDNKETFTSDPSRVPADFQNSYHVLFVYE